jgi:hypothetical protein
VTDRARAVYPRGVKKFAIVLLVLAAACGSASAKTRKPAPIRIVEPGPMMLDPSGNGIVVGDRALKRVVRVDLGTKKRRVLASRVGIPTGIAYDDMGRLYVGAGERIYRIDGSRKILVAGTGAHAHTGDGGQATAAAFAGAGEFEVDHDETIVVPEYDNWIRRIAADGAISTIAGTGVEGYTGDGGPAIDARLRHPSDIVLQRYGVVIADSDNHVLRRVDWETGTITTIARDFEGPVLAEAGPMDTLYVADAGAQVVYRLDGDGVSRTRVGTAVTPVGLTVDYSANVYVSELEARRIVRISPDGRRTVFVRR